MPNWNVERFEQTAPCYRWDVSPAAGFLRRQRSLRQQASCRVAAARRLMLLRPLQGFVLTGAYLLRLIL